MLSPIAHLVYDCRAIPKDTNANDMLASPCSLELLQPHTISIFDYNLLPPLAPEDDDHSAAILMAQPATLWATCWLQGNRDGHQWTRRRWGMGQEFVELPPNGRKEDCWSRLWVHWPSRWAKEEGPAPGNAATCCRTSIVFCRWLLGVPHRAIASHTIRAQQISYSWGYLILWSSNWHWRKNASSIRPRCQNPIDLQTHIKIPNTICNKSTPSLFNLANFLLGTNLEKGNECKQLKNSGWAIAPLNFERIRYAAFDALVSLEIAKGATNLGYMCLDE